MIPDEYLEFIAVTRQHQKQHMKEKATRRKRERSIVYNDISTMAGPAADQSDRQRTSSDNFMRTMELSHWYGEKEGHEIGEMEKRMDSKFDDNVTKYSPPFFPACPIVMKGFFDNN